MNQINQKLRKLRKNRKPRKPQITRITRNIRTIRIIQTNQTIHLSILNKKAWGDGFMFGNNLQTRNKSLPLQLALA